MVACFESLRDWLSKAASSPAARYVVPLALGEYILFGLLSKWGLLTIKPFPHYLLEDFS